METDHRYQFLCGDHIAVHRHYILFTPGNHGQALANGAAATQWSIFHAVVGPDSEPLSVTEVVLNRLPQISGQEHNISDTGLLEPLDLMLQDRSPALPAPLAWGPRRLAALTFPLYHPPESARTCLNQVPGLDYI